MHIDTEHEWAMNICGTERFFKERVEDWGTTLYSKELEFSSNGI